MDEEQSATDKLMERMAKMKPEPRKGKYPCGARW